MHRFARKTTKLLISLSFKNTPAADIKHLSIAFWRTEKVSCLISQVISENCLATAMQNNKWIDFIFLLTCYNGSDVNRRTGPGSGHGVSRVSDTFLLSCPRILRRVTPHIPRSSSDVLIVLNCLTDLSKVRI